jgi:Helix-turn-helix domain
MTRRWRNDSIFGPGPRRPLDREQRARFRFLIRAHARGRRLSAKAQWVAEALLKRLGADGHCDPSHDTLAADAGCAVRTVRRALATLKQLGLCTWVRRLVREGWRVEQSSNAYLLSVGVLNATECHVDRPTNSISKRISPQVNLLLDPKAGSAPREVAAAAAALASRRAAVEAMLRKGRSIAA